MLTASNRYRVVPPRQTTGAALYRLVLGSVLVLGVAVGGALDVQLTNRFLRQIVAAGTSATWVGDASTAHHYLDLFFMHTVAYGALALVVCGVGLFAASLRQSVSASDRPSDAAQTDRQRRFPFALTVVMVFVASVLGGGLFDRALIKWRFAHGGISSHVSTDAVLLPFYAYDALYQRLTLATAVALLLCCLVGKGLQRRRLRE